VVARTGIDPVRTGGQGIGCNTGPDHIVAVAGVDGITTQSTLDDVVAIASINVIVAVVAFDGIVARTGIDVIVAFATEHGVVAFTGIDVVVVAVTKDGVVAFATVDGVFASATADGVVAVAAHDGISTSTAVQVVRTRGSPDGIVAGTGKYSAAEAVFTDTIDIDVVVTIIEPVADGLTVVVDRFHIIQEVTSYTGVYFTEGVAEEIVEVTRGQAIHLYTVGSQVGAWVLDAATTGRDKAQGFDALYQRIIELIFQGFSGVGHRKR